MFELNGPIIQAYEKFRVVEGLNREIDPQDQEIIHLEDNCFDDFAYCMNPLTLWKRSN